MQLQYQELTSSILNTFFNVVKKLDYGFEKSIYINAIASELTLKNNYTVINQTQDIHYNGVIVGQIFFDIIVNDPVVLCIDNNYDFIKRPQIESAKKYLRHSKYEVLLLLNFGLEASYKRIFLG